MIVLILGSGPAAPRAADWPRGPFDQIVAVNNAWRIRPDWDHLIYPEDFAPERRPDTVGPSQTLVEADKFVPAQNAFGGFLYAGATMAYTAAYWALDALKPTTLAFFGCDMTYSGTQTHFYGKGTADPLRDDISLRSLEAKCARLMVHAAQQSCAVVNLSSDPSRLVAPRATLAGLHLERPAPVDWTIAEDALAREAKLGYRTPEGWHTHLAETADIEALDTIDAVWLNAVRSDPALRKAS